MARPLRITYPGTFYHATSRGNERHITETKNIIFLNFLFDNHIISEYNMIIQKIKGVIQWI